MHSPESVHLNNICLSQQFDKLESTLQNNGMSAQAAEKDNLEVKWSLWSQIFLLKNMQLLSLLMFIHVSPWPLVT